MNQDRFLALFVCSGNTCRSPMAAWALRAFLQRAGLADTVEVASAGLVAKDRGGPADPRAVAALRARGYYCDHRARQLDLDLLATAGLVLALDSGHLAVLRQVADRQGLAAPIRLLRSFDPAAAGSRATGAQDVPDPISGTARDYERTLELIEAAMPGVVDLLRARLG